MPPTKVSAVNKSDLQDAAWLPHNDGDGEKKGQGIVRDERGQEQPADKKRAQQTSATGMPQVSQSGQASGYSTSGEKKKGEA